MAHHSDYKKQRGYDSLYGTLNIIVTSLGRTCASFPQEKNNHKDSLMASDIWSVATLKRNLLSLWAPWMDTDRHKWDVRKMSGR